MEEQLQVIRAALAAPTEEARRAGANACRTLLQALESAQLPGGRAAEPALPTPLHVLPTASAAPSIQEKGSEPLLEAAPSLAATLPAATQDAVAVSPSAATQLAGSPSAATQPAGSASTAPMLPVLSGGTALGPVFSRGVGGAIDPAVVASVVSALKSLKPEQWVDLLLNKLLTFFGTQGAPPMALPPAGIPAAPAAAPVALSPYQVQLVPARPGWVPPPGNRRR